MIHEFAELEIKAESEDAFLEAVEKAVPLFQRTGGCRSMRMDKIVEKKNHFVLIVGWDSVEAHNDGFRGSPDWEEWRALVGPFLARPPEVVHLETARAFF